MGRKLGVRLLYWMWRNEKRLCVFAVIKRVRFARGTARYRTWREVERRALDGASRSLKGAFERVIMVEVRIEEMFRCAPG